MTLRTRNNILSVQDYNPFGEEIRNYPEGTSFPVESVINTNSPARNVTRKADWDVSPESDGLRQEQGIMIVKSGSLSLRGWLSVDPMAAKYPGWSPYNYCMNNPLGLVDPDGMAADVYITGEEANKAAEELQKELPNIKIVRDEKTGKLSYTGEAKTDAEKTLTGAIDDHSIQVNLETTNAEYDGEHPFFAGSYGGYEKNGDVKNTRQLINIKDCKILDNMKISTVGYSVAHEIVESYLSAKNNLSFPDCHNETLKILPDIDWTLRNCQNKKGEFLYYRIINNVTKETRDVTRSK